MRNLRLRGRAADSQSWGQVTLTPRSTLLTFLPFSGGKKEQGVSGERQQGQLPAFPAATSWAVCGPVPPSHEDSGSAKTMDTVPRGRVGVPEVIPAVGPWPSPAVEMQQVIRSSVLGGGDRREKPLLGLIPGSHAPPPSLPSWELSECWLKLRTRTWGVEGHPL